MNELLWIVLGVAVSWFLLAALTFYIETLNRNTIKAGHLIAMILFAPCAFLLAIMDLDNVVWRRKDRR